MSLSANAILEQVRRSLGRTAGSPPPAVPACLPPRLPGDLATEIERLCSEINALSGYARRLQPAQLDQALQELVQAQEIRKAVVCTTPYLIHLGIAEQLERLGVELVSPQAHKQILATCDLGVTGADFALPETGTLGLLSSDQQPRAVSLLPRVHLAILPSQALRADLHPVFAEARHRPYLVLVTGPSRTADIELTVTLGVHGPKALYAWVLVDEAGLAEVG